MQSIREVLAAIDGEDDALTFDLPAPPSINRAGAEFRLGNKAPRVQRWRRAADGYLVLTRQNRKLGKPLKGDFAIDIVWDRSLKKRGSDIDNRIKYLLDYLQDLGLFEDDWTCEDLHVRYGSVMRDGCRVQLRAWDR